MEYIIDKGKIISKYGIPQLPRYIVDNRLACQLTKQGFGDIDYFGKGNGHFKAFKKEFWGGMSLFLETNRLNMPLELSESALMPYGYTALWGNNKITVFIAKDSICMQLEPLKKQKEKWKIEFYDSYNFTPCSKGDPRYKSNISRKWNKWQLNNNYFEIKYMDGKDKTEICIGANFELTANKTAKNTKNILKSSYLQPEKAYQLVISFDSQNAQKKCRECLNNFNKILKNQELRYKKIMESIPILKSPYKSLNDFFQLAPLYHESLKVLDYPGAIRAKSTFYWVWGWDGMTANDATMYWGDMDFIKQMLEFYKDYADENGVAHAFSRNMGNIDACPPPAQGMYITLLYLYYCHGGDISDYYCFAKEIFGFILDSKIEDLGLCLGTSLFPDFRELLDETGEDISTFNNTVCYSATRSMEVLANNMKDTKTQKLAADMALKMRKNMRKVLFDEKVGFFACSAQSNTLEKRNIYHSASVKWENDFCFDLTNGLQQQILNSMKENFVSASGIRPLPTWNKAYDQDANQLSCWWPVTGEFFMRLINYCDDTQLINLWISWVEYWTKNLMCPEGISCHVQTKTPPMDNWNCLSGTWQAYSIRGWYQAIVHGIVGLSIDNGGITFYPYTGQELAIEGLHLQGKLVNIKMIGSGQYIDYIKIGDKYIYSTRLLPYEMINSNCTIEVKRTNISTKAFEIVNGSGIKLYNYKYKEGMVKAVLSGVGICKLGVECFNTCVVSLGDSQETIKGKKTFDIDFNEKSNVDIYIKEQK